jgi:hypothetical protein
MAEFIINSPNEDTEKNTNDKDVVERTFNRTLTFSENPFMDKRYSGNSRGRSGTRDFIASLKIPKLFGASKSEDPILLVNDIYNEKVVGECIIDFFNLVFGIDEDTDMFWDNIILPYAQQHFHSFFFNRNTINLHGLLHSMCYHCSVYISFDSDIKLGKIQQPFQIVQLQHIAQKSKLYKMHTVEYRTLSEKSTEYKNSANHTLALQACELKLRISKALNSDNKLGDAQILAEIGEILLENGDFDNAILKAKESLIQIHPLSGQSIRSWCILFKALHGKKLVSEASQCFENAVSALNFHWGESHPMHAEMFCMLAGIYIEQDNYSEALLLYKNALLCCLKVLGPNHASTAKVYMELSQYYILANNMENALEE